MANKKNKKIKITDIAISKVPYIKYKDIDQKCNNTLYFLAKYVLYLSKNRNNSNEVAITYELGTSLVSKNIGISLGEEHDVDPASDIKAKILKNRIKAANYFLSNCSKCGIYYSKFIN